MRLTLLSDYSMRVLMYLAINPQKLVTVSEISESYAISRNHLTKVVHQLGRAGYIETVRGRAGGIRLAKSPGEINIGQILRLVEEPSALVECFPNGKQSCVITEACKLRHVLAGAENAFYDYLDQFTLAEMTENSNALHSRLNLAGVTS